MHIIERRSPLQTVSYSIVDPRYYESVDHYVPGVSSYERLVRRHLPGSWVLTRSGLAIHAGPPDACPPESGFKIHLSSTTDTAERCLEIATATCVRERLPFKAVVDPFLLDWLNSALAPLAGSGKFVTIYPQDTAQFQRVADALADETADVRGPYVLSDAKHPRSRAVFYRYGGFVRRIERNVFGEAVAVYRRGDGQLSRDERKPVYTAPQDVEDPYGAAQPAAGEMRLRDRYMVTGLLHRSNKGGIYRAVDTVTARAVVIKEARPFVRNGDDRDATDLLRNERAILERLADTGLTPRVIDFFQEWENWFLVLEELEGEMLTQYRARSEVAVLAQQPMQARLAPLLELARSLCAGVQAIHDRGVIIGDLAPQNILVDPATRSVRFLDFETSCFADAPTRSRTGTPGFVSPSRIRGELVGVADDRFALGRLLYSIVYPVCSLFQLQPGLERELLRVLSSAKGLPFSLDRLVYDVPQDPANAGARIAELEACLTAALADAGNQPDAAAAADDDTIERDIHRMRQAILASADLTRDDRLFPADWRVFATNPLSLAFGAAGVCLFLDETGGVPIQILRRLEALSEQGAVDGCPPGLYVGLSGIAWVLARLGRVERAADLMRAAYDAPSLLDSADLFFGCAGSGLGSLHLYHHTREPLFLDKAIAAARHIASPPWTAPEGSLPQTDSGSRYHGIAHGAAGVSLFLLRLWQVTGDPAHRALAIRFLDADLDGARAIGAGLGWTSTTTGSLIAPWWRYGNAGMIPVLLRFHRAFGDARYLELARAAAAPLAAYFATVPGMFSGMAGVGAALIEVAAATGERSWLDEARRLAARLRLFAVDEPEGIGFPGEDLQRVCHDLGTGTAGVGLFFAHLRRGTVVSSPLDLDEPSSPIMDDP